MMPQICDFYPKEIIGGVGKVLAIYGLGFGQNQGSNFVSFIQESGNFLDAPQGTTLKYHRWTNTIIEVEMPIGFSGKVLVHINGIDYKSNEILKVKANLACIKANPLNYFLLINQNTTGGYTWYIHREYWENTEIKTAIEDVFRMFRRATGVNFILADMPTDETPRKTVINLIGPDPQTPYGGYFHFVFNCFPNGTNDFCYMQTMHICMSPNEHWYFGNGKVPQDKVKFRYVLMHELGHSVGLGHVDELQQTMYPTVTMQPSESWNHLDDITNEEKLAGSHFVKLSQNFLFRGNGVSPMTRITNADEIY